MEKLPLRCIPLAPWEYETLKTNKMTKLFKTPNNLKIPTRVVTVDPCVIYTDASILEGGGRTGLSPTHPGLSVHTECTTITPYPLGVEL